MYHTSDDVCPKCKREVGNYIHMVWLCPRMQEFWQAVVDDMNLISGVPLKLDPLVLLLPTTMMSLQTHGWKVRF